MLNRPMGRSGNASPKERIDLSNNGVCLSYAAYLQVRKRWARFFNELSGVKLVNVSIVIVIIL